MRKKDLTLIIIPHSKSQHKTISFSKKEIRFFTGLTIFLFVAIIVFLLDYFTMNVTRQKYKDLYAENTKQKEEIAQYEKSVNELKETIDNLDRYRKKINVMAGLKSQDILKEAGVGGGEINNQNITSLPKETGLNQVKKISQEADSIEKNLGTLTQFFEAQTLKLASTPSIWPTRGYVSSPFGWRIDPFTQKRTFHRGIDIATHFGNPVVATADGVVIETKMEKIGGKTVKISHRGGYTTVYCHLNAFKVKPGQKVERGDVIGLVGKTGKALGPHVHYEVRLNGKSINPYYYILEE